MRTLITLLALAAATPVLAQTPPPPNPLPHPPLAPSPPGRGGLLAQSYGARQTDARLTADEQALRQREVALQNRLAAEAAHAQADQAVSSLSVANARPAMPAIDPKAPPAQVEMSQFAEIPDAALAASNARAVAASQNKK